MYSRSQLAGRICQSSETDSWLLSSHGCYRYGTLIKELEALTKTYPAAHIRRLCGFGGLNSSVVTSHHSRLCGGHKRSMTSGLALIVTDTVLTHCLTGQVCLRRLSGITSLYSSKKHR